MRIWIDGQCFQTRSNLRGIGRYASDFLRAIDASGEAQLIISLNGNLAEEAIAARNYLKRTVPGAEIAIWYGIAHVGEFEGGYSAERMTDEHILAAHVNAIAPDVALSPSPFEGIVDRSSPFIRTDEIDALSVCIFHDAIPYRFSKVYLKDLSAKKLYMRKFEQIDKFGLVLCNSSFTGAEYREIYGKYNNAVIGAGLSEQFVSLLRGWAHNANSLGASFGRYVLYVGGMDWHKNVPLLVRALARVPECIAGGLKLVLAGYNSEGLVAPIAALWKERGLRPENLIWTDWISDVDLVDLYRNAAVMVQPSLMEGFGLSALEAMAAGCPFLSSRGGAVAEVVENEELLFDPESPPQLAHLVSRMLNDAPFRERMIAFGLERSRALTWDGAARTALDAMRGAMEASGRAQRVERESAGQLDPPRLLMDVSSTAQSPVLSGIQRVMHRLSNGMLELNKTDSQQTVLSYCRDDLGWYDLPRLAKSAVSLNPRHRLSFQNNDTYFLLDSSWNFTDGQRRRLLDAMVMGQEVVHGIHDLGPLTMSAMTDKGMPPAFRTWFEFILGRSTGIVCVSRAVADEIYELVQAIKLPRPMKIGYFRLGGDFADSPADYSWLTFTGGRPTFLMVGTIEPRKGHVIALEAFERLWLEGVDVNLLIIGSAGWDTKLLRARFETHPEAEHRLFVRSGLSDGALRAAYRVATALVMTSYLEGFGLPVVEAGVLGCPVILNDIPVFREVGKGAPAARYFRRGDSSDLAGVVREVAESGFGKPTDATFDWPSWSGSAREVKNVLFGGEWYRHYEPKEILPNTRLSDIGEVRMTRPLKVHEREHSMRLVEGPLVSDDGAELRFVVALRNESSAIWSSNLPDGGKFAINVGSHIYARNGTCLDYENARTPIPFVLCPGQEICVPVRVPTDWLTREATTLGVEIVQEAVAWLGEGMRLESAAASVN